MTKRTIYISGPMTGIEDFNYPLFNRVTAQLRSNGHTVYNPAEFCENNGIAPENIDLRAAFAEYCNFICTAADTLLLLPGWQKSQGATAEFSLALNLPIEVIEWHKTEFGEWSLKLMVPHFARSA